VATWSADARYTRLIAEHGAALMRFAVMLAGNPHDAEDAVQDVLITVAKAWPVSRPLPYLKRAVANRVVDLARKRRDVLTDSLPETAYDEPRFLRHEEDREFFTLVQSLPERQRQVVVLRYLADLGDAEIARILGCTQQTVRSQVHHGLAKLRVDDNVLERWENR
jgi:RNA polymerase sigma factor (sigma-70 family)